MLSRILIKIILIFVLSSNVTHSSFNHIPSHVKAKHLFPRLSGEEHFKIRIVNHESNQLFLRLHATVSHEMKQWNNLRDFLLNLHTQQLSVSTSWKNELKQLCTFTNYSIQH
eukprot:318999_1